MSRLAGTLCVIALAVLFVVPGGMLWFMGYNYEGITGNPLTKIHPGSYLVFFTFGLVALQDGNPLRSAVEIAAHRPGSLVLLGAAVIAFAQIILRSAPGMAGIVDTYMLPPILCGLFARADLTTEDRIERVVHGAMICNALLGLFEFATHHLYFPFRFDGTLFEEDTRSTALQGHPLGNAIITAIYLLALAAGGGRMPGTARGGIILLQAMALVAFGGRAAIVTSMVLGGAAGFVGLWRVLRSGRVPLLGAAAAIVLATAAPIGLVSLVVGGFFDALLQRFANDGGSAATRVEMLSLLARIPFRDLLVGPDIPWVESLRRTSGLEMGIENPVVKTVLYQGIVMTALLILGIGLFLYETARCSRRGMLLPILAFLIIVNTFEGLASKSTLLAKFAVMMLALFRPERRASASLPGPSIGAPSGRLARPSVGRLPSTVLRYDEAWAHDGSWDEGRAP